MSEEWAVRRIRIDQACHFADTCNSRAEIEFGGVPYCLPCGMTKLAERLRDSMREALANEGVWSA